MDVLAHGGEGVVGTAVVLLPLIAVVAVLVVSWRAGRREAAEGRAAAEREGSAAPDTDALSDAAPAEAPSDAASSDAARSPRE